MKLLLGWWWGWGLAAGDGGIISTGLYVHTVYIYV